LTASSVPDDRVIIHAEWTENEYPVYIAKFEIVVIVGFNSGLPVR